MNDNIKVGDTIRIDVCNDEIHWDDYPGRVGVITAIVKDPWGDYAIYGTWGGCALYEEAGDSFTVIKRKEE